MATNLHRVWSNTVWRIESITPAATRGTLRTKFRHLNGSVEPGSASGTGRGFDVRRLSRTGSDEPTSLYARTADHTYQVDVYYPREMKQDALEEIISQDAHDIITALRDPYGWTGYDATHTTGDIGIKDRIETGDAVEVKPGNVILTIRVRTRVREVER